MKVEITIKKIFKKGKKISFLNQDDVWFGAWLDQYEQAGLDWKQGQNVEFDYEVKSYEGKGYNNIILPKVLKLKNQPYTPNNAQMTDAIKITLERIEKKLDRLLDIETSISNKVMSKFEDPKDIPQMPFEGDPAPTDEDAPF